MSAAEAAQIFRWPFKPVIELEPFKVRDLIVGADRSERSFQYPPRSARVNDRFGEMCCICK